MYINTLARHRLGRFLREGEEGGGGGAEGGQQSGEGGKEFKAPASQAELDAIIEKRVARERAKYKDYDTYKASHQSWQELLAESMTEEEKTEEQVRAEVFNEVMSAQVPRVVRAEFKVAAREAGMDKETLDSLLEDLDLVKYAKDDGEPDEEKIAKKVAAFAPKKKSGEEEEEPPKKKYQSTGFGQGRGHQQSKLRPGESGLAEAMRRYPDAFPNAGAQKVS